METPKLFDPKAAVAKRDGSYLPHWSQEDSTYFVTYRLIDSMPQEVLAQWRNERNLLNTREKAGEIAPDEYRRRQKLLTRRMEQYLDNGYGETLLGRPEIAALVRDNLLYFDNNRYLLWSWCLMPNHVHAVVQPKNGLELESILHSWKSYTGHQMNRLLARSGARWEPESFDHLIRNERSFLWCVEYAYRNPETAGLKHWEWRGKRACSWNSLEH
jgi:REP element-mobilizing transposase RayT